VLFLLPAVLVCLHAKVPPSPIPAQIHDTSPRPVFRVEVVEKVTIAINYRHRSGATTIDFCGTPLMALAQGRAKVESKRGYIEIEVEFNNVLPAMTWRAPPTSCGRSPPRPRCPR
jgi:hypothetical protein